MVIPLEPAGTTGHSRPSIKSRRTGHAAFQFVVTTPFHGLNDQDRRTIKGNATRKRKGQRRIPELQSWIVPNHRLELVNRVNAGHEKAVPKRVGNDFSGLQLPSGFEPHMVQELLIGFHFSKLARYPYEICIDVPPMERGWFSYMLSDACCLHSMLFSLRVHESRTSRLAFDQVACYHYAQTLSLLQARLQERDQSNAVSDATIMVVMMLASAAEMMNEYDVVENHIKGLEKIVKLRGGVRALTTHTNMPVKVCRADLSYALSTGRQPFLFGNEIAWECFIFGRDFLKCTSEPSGIPAEGHSYFHPKLRNVLRDVHSLSSLSNLAHQTGRRLSPELYNEMAISVLYRLTSLSFETDDLQEAVRMGLLCFCTTIFMQKQYVEQPYDRLLNKLLLSLHSLRQMTNNKDENSSIFWLLMVVAVMAEGNRLASVHWPRWHSTWLYEIKINEKINSWPQARDLLRSIAWIDFVHDEFGKKTYDALDDTGPPLSTANSTHT